MRKKLTLLLSWVFFLSFGVASTVNAQTISTHASADSLRAGDLFTLSVTLTTAQPYDEIIFPDSAYFGKRFELRKKRHYRITDFKDSLVYRLQFWGVSDAKLSSLPVLLISEDDTTILYTQPVSVAFQSVLEAKEPILRPLKPIFEFARAWWLYGLILLLLILAAALWYYFYQKRKKQPEVEPREFKPQPFLNPLRELEDNLQQLKPVLDNNNINFKQFYIDLGDAIRLYFEQMYNIPALESTSSEILYELKRRAVDDMIIEDTQTVLNEADMVKFANFKPTKEQAKKVLGNANNFLSTVKEKHRNKVERMRRQHFEMVEQERKAFQQTKGQKETA